MYETQAVLKNVNLRTELAGDERHGAFDLKFETMLTPELHARLCGHPDEKDQVTPSQLRKSGINEIKYDTEIENVRVTFGKTEVKDAKLNKVMGRVGTDYKVEFRVQAKLNVRGLAEELNEMIGEPHHLKIEELQGDMLNEAKEEEQKPAPKKKRAAKKKASTATKTPDMSAPERTGLKTEGQTDEKLSEEEIAAREAEKKRLLAQQKPSKGEHDGVKDIIDDMIVAIKDVKMGQGDKHEFDMLKDKIDAGRMLTAVQEEKLNDLYVKYTGQQAA